MRYREWEIVKNCYEPKDYGIPEAPQAPAVPEDHPEHLSAENPMKARR